MTRCVALVPVGNYSYAARNTERRCHNTATHGNYCHVHKGRNVTPADRALFEAIRAQLTD